MHGSLIIWIAANITAVIPVIILSFFTLIAVPSIRDIPDAEFYRAGVIIGLAIVMIASLAFSGTLVMFMLRSTAALRAALHDKPTNCRVSVTAAILLFISGGFGALEASSNFILFPNWIDALGLASALLMIFTGVLLLQARAVLKTRQTQKQLAEAAATST